MSFVLGCLFFLEAGFSARVLAVNDEKSGYVSKISNAILYGGVGLFGAAIVYGIYSSVSQGLNGLSDESNYKRSSDHFKNFGFSSQGRDHSDNFSYGTSYTDDDFDEFFRFFFRNNGYGDNGRGYQSTYSNNSSQYDNDNGYDQQFGSTYANDHPTAVVNLNRLSELEQPIRSAISCDSVEECQRRSDELLRRLYSEVVIMGHNDPNKSDGDLNDANVEIRFRGSMSQERFSEIFSNIRQLDYSSNGYTSAHRLLVAFVRINRALRRETTTAGVGGMD